MTKTLADLARTSMSRKVYLAEVGDPYAKQEPTLADTLGLIPPATDKPSSDFRLYRVLGTHRHALDCDSTRLVALDVDVTPEDFNCNGDPVVSVNITSDLNIPCAKITWNTLSLARHSHMSCDTERASFALFAEPEIKALDLNCTHTHKIINNCDRAFEDVWLNWGGKDKQGRPVGNQRMDYTSRVGPHDTWEYGISDCDLGVGQMELVILNWRGGQSSAYRSTNGYFRTLTWQCPAPS